MYKILYALMFSRQKLYYKKKKKSKSMDASNREKRSHPSINYLSHGNVAHIQRWRSRRLYIKSYSHASFNFFLLLCSAIFHLYATHKLLYLFLLNDFTLLKIIFFSFQSHFFFEDYKLHFGDW